MSSVADGQPGAPSLGWVGRRFHGMMPAMDLLVFALVGLAVLPIAAWSIASGAETDVSRWHGRLDEIEREAVRLRGALKGQRGGGRLGTR